MNIYEELFLLIFIKFCKNIEKSEEEHKGITESFVDFVGRIMRVFLMISNFSLIP